MKAKILFIGLLLASVCFYACNGNKADETNTEATEAAAPVPAEEAPIVAPSPPATDNSAIESRPGPKGSTVNLTKCQVTGKILNVEFRVNPEQKNGKGAFTSVSIPLADVYIIDDATVKKAGLLKDNTGSYLANPIQSNSQKNAFSAGTDAMVFTFKFPAPPEASQTVSISVPEFGSFDGVPVSR